MGLLIAGAIALVIVLGFAGFVTYTVREPGRRVRRKELAASTKTVNAIDDLVDRYHPQLDVVGQAMAGEIREVISKHRKGITR